MKKINYIYNVEGEQSGFIQSLKTLEEAKKFIKELKEFDKRQNIEDTYYIIKEKI